MDMPRTPVLLLSLTGLVAAPAAVRVDCLLHPSPYKAQVARSADGRDVVLDNGLVRRVVRLVPNAATVSFENFMTGESIIHAVRPEARVVLDGALYDFESRDPKYQAQVKELADYGKSKGIVVGGYSLCSSRPAGTKADNTVGPTAFGVAPCLGAKWGRDHLEQLQGFVENADPGVLESRRCRALA